MAMHFCKRSNPLNVNCDYIIYAEKFQTITKVRVLAGQSYAARQQVIRIDYENKTAVESEIRLQLMQNLVAACENADAIIISDYTLNPDLGVVNAEIAAVAQQIAEEKQIPLVVDSRFRLREFPGATSATPNQDEIEQILGQEFSEDNCDNLLDTLGCKSLIITRGNKGMLLIEKDKTPFRIDAIGSKEPVDVTGAGDTVIATYALSLASGFSFAESAEIANHAGGIVVMKKRTASASIEELIESLKSRATIEQKAQTK